MTTPVSLKEEGSNYLESFTSLTLFILLPYWHLENAIRPKIIHKLAGGDLFILSYVTFHFRNKLYDIFPPKPCSTREQIIGIAMVSKRDFGNVT